MEKLKQGEINKNNWTITSGVSHHLLDDCFTILWVNDPFYKIMDVNNHSSLSSLKELFQQKTLIFEEFHDVIMAAYENNQDFIQYNLEIPTCSSSSIWLSLQANIIRNKDIDSATLMIIYSSHSNDENYNDYFEWMMSEYGGNVYISDMDTYELLYVNQHASDTLHLTKEQVIGKHCYEAIQGLNSPCSFCTNSHLKPNETYEWEFYNPNLKRTFMIKNRILYWQGHRARIELSYDMYSYEFKLAKKDQEREAILNTIPAGMTRVDARDGYTILWYSGIFLNMIGYTKEQFKNELHNSCNYMHPDDLKRAQHLAQSLKKTGENVIFEARAYTREREERILTVSLCYVSGDDSWDGIPSYYSIGLDITNERRKIEKLQFKAEKDALTGIYNREGIENKISKYISEKHEGMSALFMIDTDNFKYINDTYGHMTGDVVLSELASGMKFILSDSDIVGRIGGDEFMIFLKSISSENEAKEKAEQLLEIFRNLFKNEKGKLKVTCSIGIALYPKDGDSFQKMYSSADQALYQAKTRGKNNYMIYDSEQKADELSNSFIRTKIDSEHKYEDSNNLACYVFRTLYLMEDTNKAINKILEFVGKQYDVSRVYIFERSADGNYCSNTYEWCAEGIHHEINALQELDFNQMEDYQLFFDQDDIFYCRDIQLLDARWYEFFSKQGIHSLLQCAFRENSVVTGFVGFDECTGNRLWLKDEVSSLSLISQILATFLKLKKANNCYKWKK